MQSIYFAYLYLFPPCKFYFFYMYLISVFAKHFPLSLFVISVCKIYTSHTIICYLYIIFISYNNPCYLPMQNSFCSFLYLYSTFVKCVLPILYLFTRLQTMYSLIIFVPPFPYLHILSRWVSWRPSFVIFLQYCVHQ